MQWIIKANEPFAGHAQSILNPDGTVAYTEGLTVEQYEQERGYPVRVIDDTELDRLIDKHRDGMITKPKPVSRDRYWYSLEVLPPCRWHTVSGFEVFHVSERITHDLVEWSACRGERYWQWTDRAGISDGDLVAKLRDAA